MEQSNELVQIDQTLALAARLMKTPHYAKLGETGIFAIIQKAKSIGMDALDALNGGMYFVSGKVELSGQAMNALIRSKGHSIIKDSRSTSDCCVLRGKRADNQDIMVASFSMAEAKRAGLTTAVWSKYPEDMLFWKALSRLARQLFPDVIKGCYVQGEIQEDFLKEIPKTEPTVLPPEHISAEQIAALKKVFDEAEEEFQKTALDYLERNGIDRDFSNFPLSMYDRLYRSSTQRKKAIEI